MARRNRTTEGAPHDPGNLRPSRNRRRRPPSGNGVRGRTAAAGTILIVWAVSTVADIWSTTYSPPEGVNTLALAAATYLFGSAFLKERG